MQKQNQPITFSLPLSNLECESSMPSQETAPQRQPGGGDTDADDMTASAAPEDFEFCILSSGGIATVGDDAAGMCVADEVFSDGKLLPLSLSSAASADASALLLLRSDSLEGGATTAGSSCSSGFSSRSDSRSASSSSSSSSVSRSASLKSASSDSVGRSQSSRSVAFYAHPSTSPRPQPRRRSGSSAASAARRSTGSAPPAAWGIIRLGVVGAPEVYPPRASLSRKAAVARGGSRSARLEQPSAAAKEAVALDKNLALGFFGAGLVCSCSPDAVEPVGSAEAATAAARRRRKKAEEKKKGGVTSAESALPKSRILAWLEISVTKNKSAV